MTLWDNFIDLVSNAVDFAMWTMVSIIVIISYVFVFVAVAIIYVCIAIMQFFDLILYGEKMTIKDDIKDFIIAVKELFRYLKTLSVDEN